MSIELLQKITEAARSERPKGGLGLEVVRELSDLDMALPPVAPPAKVSTLPEIQGIHHTYARLLGEGKSVAQVAAIMGTSGARLRRLMEDPAFCELMAYYQEQKEDIWMGAQKQMALLHRIATDEIIRRVEDDIEKKIPLSELRLLSEMAGDRSVTPPLKNADGGGGTTKITFNFRPLTSKDDILPTIEGTIEGAATTTSEEEKS